MGGSFQSSSEDVCMCDGDVTSEVRRILGIGMNFDVYLKHDSGRSTNKTKASVTDYWVVSSTYQMISDPSMFETSWVLTKDDVLVPSNILKNTSAKVKWFRVLVKSHGASFESGVRHESVDNNMRRFVRLVGPDEPFTKGHESWFIEKEEDSRMGEHSSVYFENHGAKSRDAWSVRFHSLPGCVFLKFDEPPVWSSGNSFDINDTEQIFRVMKCAGFDKYALLNVGRDRRVEFEIKSDDMELVSDSMKYVEANNPLKTDEISYISFNTSEATEYLRNQITKALDGNIIESFNLDIKAEDVKLGVKRGVFYTKGR